jgi:hypothetical protein
MVIISILFQFLFLRGDRRIVKQTIRALERSLYHKCRGIEAGAPMTNNTLMTLNYSDMRK